MDEELFLRLLKDDPHRRATDRRRPGYVRIWADDVSQRYAVESGNHDLIGVWLELAEWARAHGGDVEAVSRRRSRGLDARVRRVRPQQGSSHLVLWLPAELLSD